MYRNELLNFTSSNHFINRLSSDFRVLSVTDAKYFEQSESNHK